MSGACDRGSAARQRRSHLCALSFSAVAWSALLLGCSTATPPSDGDAATSTDTGSVTSGTTGGNAGLGGASGSGGAAGSGGAGGSAAAGAGSGGTTGGRGGTEDGGGAAGSSRDGQAGSSGGAVDAARDGADVSSDASFGPDGDADARAEAAADNTDARADVTAPPSDVDAMPPSDGSACTLPSAGLYATFRVINDVFYASITNPPGIDQAIALWRGQSQANIPVGKLECGNGTYNCGWTWRMNPATITFAEITIEVCDGTPSYVQDNCPSFPNGQYCPWSAQLIALGDCRTDPGCPAVPR